MKTTRTIPLVPIRLRAELAPSETGKRRAQATIYTGAEMERFDAFDGEHTLRLDLGGVDLSRFNSGAPVTRNHSRDVDDVVGVTERAWVAAGAAHAILRLSDREDLAPLWADMQSGVIRNVSMDVALLELEDVTKRGGKRALLATKWQPIGLAIVPAGADPGAQMMALEDGPTHPCRLTVDGGNAMRKRTRCPACREKLNHEGDEELTECGSCGADLEEAEREQTELARIGRLHQVAEIYALDDLWVRRHIDLSVKDFVAAARREAASRQPEIDGRLTIGRDWDSSVERYQSMAAALASDAPGPGQRYRGLAIPEVAREVLTMTRRHHEIVSRRPGRRDVELAMTTSDFPGLLANALSKTLQPAYMQAPASYRLIAAQRPFRDYRPQRIVRAGDFPLTLQVGEGGEITEGPMGEGSETVTVVKYGRILNLTWEVLINDDLSAFRDFGGMVARRVVDRENALFYATCITTAAGLGPNLADGVAVHNSAHGNINSAGALDNTRLTEAFGLMAVQTSIDGLKLNVSPRYVLTSATSHILARTLLTAIYPAQATSVSPFVGMLDAVFDANLTGTRYYVIADPAALPGYVYGSVDGLGPRFEVRQGFEIEGIQAKVVHDFGTGAVDFRHSVSGAGS